MATPPRTGINVLEIAQGATTNASASRRFVASAQQRSFEIRVRVRRKLLGRTRSRAVARIPPEYAPERDRYRQASVWCSAIRWQLPPGLDPMTLSATAP